MADDNLLWPLVGFYVTSAVVLGYRQVVWTRRRKAAGESVAGPIGQFIFVVLFAPLAMLLVCAFIWSASHTLGGLGSVDEVPHP
jgi:hypothetical protein